MLLLIFVLLFIAISLAWIEFKRSATIIFLVGFLISVISFVQDITTKTQVSL